MRQKVEFIIAILFLAGLVAVSRNISKYVSSTEVEGKKNVVVIDAGHGGADPGKVGVNDALEKDLNLSIALKVKERLEKKKVEVILTRDSDTMLGKEGANNKKVEDLKARVAMINEKKPSLVVSIHQNSYHEETVSGAQVFYYANSTDGEKQAKIMQESLLACDKDNNRQAKANNTYYLLKRTEVPTIIVECGFLSNWKEAKLLITEKYQDKMADAITAGIQKCLAQ